MSVSPNIGEGVATALSADGNGRVIAAFERAGYLESEGRVFAVLSTAFASGPVHARVARLPRMGVGAPVAIRGGSLLVDGIRVELSADVWAPPRTDLSPTTAERLLDVLDHEPDLGLGASSGRSVEPALAELLIGTDMRAACALLIGRGSGLTPAGDDVAAGLLLAQCLLGLGADTERVVIAESAPTHSISRSFLCWAARGQSIEPIHRLLGACTRGDVSAMAAHRAELSAIGHTSGLDLAYGVLVGLRCMGVASAAPTDRDRRQSAKALIQTST